MKKLIKTLIIICVMFISSTVYAASASINTSSKNCYVGDKVTVTVTLYAGTWNVTVSGAASDKIVGFDMDGNVSTTKTYNIDTSSVGTKVVSITGDITDYDTDVTDNITKSVTINISERPNLPTTTTTTKKVTTTQATTLEPGEVKGDEVTTEVVTTTVLIDYDFKINVVGYEVDFDKNNNKYTINVDEAVNQLYVIVEGEGLETNGNNIVDIKDKDAFDIVVKHGDEERKYTYSINRTKQTNSKDEESFLFVISLVLLTLIIAEFGAIVYLSKKRNESSSKH